MGKSVTRLSLVTSVLKRVGLSRNESSYLVGFMIDEICNAIIREDIVKLSSFATFQIRKKNQRVGRNPRTGEELIILKRRVMTFKASGVLKKRILNAHVARNAKSFDVLILSLFCLLFCMHFLYGLAFLNL
ncbi:Integration host factor alpha subunit [Liberibacter crescens BT-1]|uniref:Integration host factor subunit alpha n=1 Tax=Liberibacter crescens (strain BT-1) TaxID=1215343 RepID=L0EUK9_LIBCB|nr:Integration host factor alpha subunit [Liberibacter crescens BT-1]